MMREVLTRRFARMVKEEAGSSNLGPDGGNAPTWS
jgi:hypothetical protein